MGVKDVAARAGVSVGTVSNVLNRPELVSAPTKSRVLQAIAELGFVRNESGRQLRAGRSRSIAYLMLDAANPFFTDVAKGIEDVARVHGVAVFICNSDGDASRESEYLDLLLQQRVRGILVTPVDQDTTPLDGVLRQGLPVVLVDRAGGTSWCSVGVDDVEGGMLAVTHLSEQGHQRIAFVGGPMTTVQVIDRLEGSRRAVAASGLSADALVVIETTATSVAEGRRAGERLVGLPRARRPTAAFCANDLLALGLLQQMTRMGVDVPSELAIVGYDDIEFAGAAAVPLSSVRQPRELLGRTAAELLFAESDADEAHVHQQVVFHPELVVRASSIKRRREPARQLVPVERRLGPDRSRRQRSLDEAATGTHVVEHAVGDRLDDGVARDGRLDRPGEHGPLARARAESPEQRDRRSAANEVDLVGGRPAHGFDGANSRPPRQGERVEDQTCELRGRGGHGLARLGTRRGEARGEVTGCGEAGIVRVDHAAASRYVLGCGDQLLHAHVGTVG